MQCTASKQLETRLCNVCMQGSVQCCVTGPAFQHMLQLADASVLETVMANVSVFARMRSQQKGQVMDLLGSRGLHHNLDGLQRHIPVSERVHSFISFNHSASFEAGSNSTSC